VRYDILPYDPNHGGTVEKLLKAASLTVHGLKRFDFRDDPLGYVDGRNRNRKASPLRFKIGRFCSADGSNELRLIAIWDDRDNRGGVLSRANLFNALCPALQGWMRGSSLANEAPRGEEVDQVGGDVDELGHVLNPVFRLDDIQRNGRFHQAVERWRSDGRVNLIQQFLSATAEGKFAGLRNQAWYKELAEK
jgi:hypothetical protein